MDEASENSRVLLKFKINKFLPIYYNIKGARVQRAVEARKLTFIAFLPPFYRYCHSHALCVDKYFLNLLKYGKVIFGKFSLLGNSCEL